METKWLAFTEAARHLKMGRSTAYELVQDGKLTAHKVARQWRFDAKELDRRLMFGKLALSAGRR